MDQVNAFLKALKKQHFWVLCAVVPLVSVSAWYLSTNKLAQAYDQAKTEINNKMRVLKKIAGEPNHPNTKIHEGMDGEIRRRRDNVFEAWDTKWKQSIDILTWPEELTPEFVAAAKQLQPIEKFSPNDPEGLAAGFLDEYRDYIKEELPKLAGIIGARWIGDDAGSTLATGNRMRMPGIGTRSSSGSRVTPDDDSIVVWNPDDQRRIEDEHFDWSKQPRNRPTTLQVLYAQEDLWVLTALLRIIEATNQGAVTNASASVKEIVSVDLGHDAVDQDGEIEIVEGPEGAKSAGRPSRTPKGGLIEMGLGGPRRMRVGEAAEVDPADFRYVDEKYEPLAGADVRGAVTGKAANPLLAVAKRMPVRFRLVMDQRKIDNLLIECANSKLIVEVRQFRFNPDAAVENAGSRGGGGIRGGGRSGGRRPRRAMGPRRGPEEEYDETYEVEVEFYGIIYVYNPVDRTLLGYDEADAIPASAP